MSPAIATDLVMRMLDFHVVDGGPRPRPATGPTGEHTAPRPNDCAARRGQLRASRAYPQEPLRALVALLALAAVVAPIVVAFKARGADPLLRAYACYWAVAVALLCVVFVLTPNATDLGPKSVNYLLTLAPAGAVGVALIAARARRAQLVVALGVATVAAVNIFGVVGGRAEVTGLAALQTYHEPLVRLLERKGVTRGFAGYWDAQNLSWQTGMNLLIAPIRNCGTQLCPYNFFTIRSWYEPGAGRTFSPARPDGQRSPCAAVRLRSAVETHRFGPLTLYLFDYDIARHVRLRRLDCLLPCAGL